MKKEELEKEIQDIESKAGKGEFTKGTETMVYQQTMLNKLYVKIINEFNEKTNIYNNRLLFYTIVIALLTVALVIKSFISK